MLEDLQPPTATPPEKKVHKEGNTCLQEADFDPI